MKRLYEEVAFVSYHFNWDRQTVMDMEHAERRKWCEEISQINKKMNEEPRKESSIENIV